MFADNKADHRYFAELGKKAEQRLKEWRRKYPEYADGQEERQ
jgi:hypothetical protein